MSTTEPNTGTTETSTVPDNVQAAIKLAGDLTKATKNATVAASVLLAAPEEETIALRAFVDRCTAQASAVEAIKKTNAANRPPSRQRG